VVCSHPASAIDQSAIATVQATVRRRLLASFVRRDLLDQNDAHAMAQWAHDGGILRKPIEQCCPSAIKNPGARPGG
jgi:hypothetical protein